MIAPDEILTRIDALYIDNSEERDYLGASEVGADCTRYLWLKFHRYIHPKKWEPRMLRLFDRGANEEPIFQANLNAIGFEFESGCSDQAGFADGFFKGHGDGVMILDGVRYAAEYKTHNLKNFNTLKPGTLALTFPKHYAQAQVYMHYFKCQYCVYLAVCKDDDRLFCDVIEYNDKDFQTYKAKADYIATTDHPPERIASRPTDYRCKMCDAAAVCWGLEMPRVDCRNCTSASKKDGKWSCDIGNMEVCQYHSFNPFAMQDIFKWEPIEFFPKERAVKYTLPSGETLINGCPPFGVASEELKF